MYQVGQDILDLVRYLVGQDTQVYPVGQAIVVSRVILALAVGQDIQVFLGGRDILVSVVYLDGVVTQE